MVEGSMIDWADHETVVLTLISGDLKNHEVAGNFIQTGNNTGIMVSIFSYSPGAEKFSGIHKNTFFLEEFLKLLNIQR